MKRTGLLVAALAAGFTSLLVSTGWHSRAALSVSAPKATPDASSDTAPHYDSSGALVRPEGYTTWVFVGGSIGLTYETPQHQSSPGEFHDVYLRPESYREYLRTGKFPEKTVLVLALYPPNEKVSPAKGGYFEGDLDGLAVAVKDREHFREAWAYFNFGEAPNLKATATANPKENCYSCHNQHAADDNVFVQFYPILRPLMKHPRN